MNFGEILETIEAKVSLVESLIAEEDRRSIRKEIESHIFEIREYLGLPCDGKAEDAGPCEGFLDEDCQLSYPDQYQLLSMAVRRAYHDLRGKGYVCYADLLCCQTCASSVVDGDKYVYWHAQDTDTADRDGKLFLSWDGEGGEIVESLRGIGLEVEWDGGPGRRIVVRRLQDSIREVAA